MFAKVGQFFARKSVKRSLMSGAVFLTVLIGGAYIVPAQIPLFQWMSSFHGNGSGAIANAGRSEMPTGGSGLPEDDPVRNFFKTGVGHVLFTATASDNCRRNLFDNHTGATYEAGEIFCGQSADQEAQSSNRLMQMGKQFKKER